MFLGEDRVRVASRGRLARGRNLLDAERRELSLGRGFVERVQDKVVDGGRRPEVGTGRRGF